MLSKTAEYALRALVHIASRTEGGPALAREVSEAAGIPHNYLTKILHGLRRAGVLEAARGKGGGYQLARAPGAIRVVDVIAVFDDLTSFGGCFLRGGRCSADDPCEAHDRWRPIASQVVRFLNETTLEQLASAH